MKRYIMTGILAAMLSFAFFVSASNPTSAAIPTNTPIVTAAATLGPYVTTPIRTWGPYGYGYNLNAAFSPNGRYIVIQSETNVQLLDAQSFQVLQTFSPRIEMFCGVFSPDSRYLLTCDNVDSSGILKFWDVQTGQSVRSFVGSYFSVTFSPDGRSILVLGRYGKPPALLDA